MDRRLLLKGMTGAAGLQLLSPAWAQPKEGRWLRLESNNFIIYSAGSEAKSREETVALERYHSLLSRLMPRKERNSAKLSVYVADDDRDFLASSPDIGKGIAGFYDSSIEQVRAVTAPKRSNERQADMQRNIRAMDARVILFHEYAHHFLFSNSRVTYPRWYNEGFAEFVSTADFSDKGIFVGKFTANRAIWLSNGDWLNIEKFLSGKDLTGKDDMSMFYAQAWLATHYLYMNAERAAGFDRYCFAVQEGGDPLGAFESAFGISPKAFDKELRDYKRKSVQFMLLPEEKVDHAATLKVERLGPSADDLLMPTGYLRSVPPKKVAGGTIAKVREVAKKFPADPFAMRALTMTEIWYGDPAEARKLIDQLLLVDMKNAETQHLNGLWYLRAAYASDDPAPLAQMARGAFTAAHRIDGTRAVSLFRYVECDLLVEGEMTDHMIDVLVTAYLLAPQIKVLALVTGQALIQHERWDEAMFVLRPLASAAHGGDLPERAKVYLDAARDRKQTQFAFYGAANKLQDDYE